MADQAQQANDLSSFTQEEVEATIQKRLEQLKPKEKNKSQPDKASDTSRAKKRRIVKSEQTFVVVEKRPYNRLAPIRPVGSLPV